MNHSETKHPLRILASQLAIPELASQLKRSANFPYELLQSDHISPGTAFDVALISRDVTASSTKQKIIPSTQAFYDLLLGSSDLRWVQIHSAGADRLIYLDLMKRGVMISGSSGVNAPVVIQNAIAGILMLARKFPQMLNAQTEHRWDSLINYPLPEDLSTQTAVIVGRGPIGDGIARALHLFGVKTILVGFNAALKEKRVSEGSAIHISQIQEVLPQAQWLVLACPLSNDTRGLLDRAAFNLLPPAAKVINIARGEIINEPDLIAALQGKQLGGAYLDVFAFEPLDAASPLWDMENVIVTPHSAGHSAGNEQRVLELFISNLHLFADGQTLKNHIAS
jgi:phosphoglycerate dehydrogenase-like enzyme